MIIHVKFVSIPVKDQQKALDFYTKTLGFKKTTDVPFGEGVRWLEVQPPGGETKLVLFPPSPEMPINCPNLVFACENVEKTYEEYKKRGVKFKEGPTKQSWGTYAIFRDIDGNEFVLSSSE